MSEQGNTGYYQLSVTSKSLYISYHFVLYHLL